MVKYRNQYSAFLVQDNVITRNLTTNVFIKFTGNQRTQTIEILKYPLANPMIPLPKPKVGTWRVLPTLLTGSFQ
jgi:hypothetical protein